MEMDEFNDKHKHNRQVHEIHIIFDNGIEITDNRKTKALESGIAEVVKKIKTTIKDINRTPLK